MGLEEKYHLRIQKSEDAGEVYFAEDVEYVISELEAKQLTNGKILFMDLCSRLIKHITEASDMTDPENHDIELALVRIIADRDRLIELLEPLYEAIKPYGEKVCPHGNTTKYPTHGWWCDECWNPVVDYFENRGG